MSLGLALPMRLRVPMRRLQSETARTIWPFLPPALLACLLVGPVVSIDTTIYASTPLWLAVPHYPALYPLFVRAVSVLASILGWIASGPAPHLAIENPAPFTSDAAAFTLAIQHVLLLASAAYLACRLRSDLLGRRLVVAVLSLNPFTLQMVHGIHSEALVIPAVYAASAEAFVVLTRPSRHLRSCAAFLGWTLLASLARHPAAVLGALVPIGFVFQAGVGLAQRNWPALRGALGALALVALGLVGVEAASFAANAAVMRQLHMELRSVPGRAYAYRLAEAYAGTPSMPGLDKARFERVVAHLKATAASPELVQDIETIARDPAPWTGAYRNISNAVEASCPNCSQDRIFAETDRRLNRVMRHAVSTWDPDLLGDALLRAANFLAPYVTGHWPAQTFGMEVTPTTAFDPYSGFPWPARDLEAVLSGSSAFLRNFLFTIAVGAVLLSLAFGSRRWLGSLGLGLLGTAAAYSMLVSFVTIYIPRYGLFVDQLALIAVVVTFAARPPPGRAHASAFQHALHRPVSAIAPPGGRRGSAVEE